MADASLELSNFIDKKLDCKIYEQIKKLLLKSNKATYKYYVEKYEIYYKNSFSDAMNIILQSLSTN